MPENFQQTVNLREKMDRLKRSKPARASRAEDIDQVFNSEEEGKMAGQGYDKINQPKFKQINELVFKRLIILLAIILIGVTVYYLFFKGESEPKDQMQNWYAVKLVTGEVYYGQISNIAADPVVINNVYYNYDQPAGGEEKSEAGNLRLVKRGQETHGPAGTMNIVRSQVVYMEQLKEDSKVLKAILDYEQ